MESGFSGERLIVIPQPMLDLIIDSPLTGDLYIHSLGHIAHAAYHSVERPQGISEYTFIYCSDGRGHIETGGETYTFSANQYMILTLNTPHSYRADPDDPWSIYWVRFAGEKGAVFASEMHTPKTLQPSVYWRMDERLEAFEKIYSILCGGYTIDNMNFSNIAFMHLLASFRYADLFGQSQSALTHAGGTVSRVTHFMNDNVEKQLTLKELAAVAGYSESYFHRKFVEETGYSPIDYFIHMKINKAVIYLLKTSMSISQIADKLGFNSPNYFSRTFTSIVGISARDFRRQGFRL